MASPPSTLELIAAATAALPQLVRVPQPPLGFGVDLVCFQDLDPNGVEIASDSPQAVAQDLFHRLNTVHGSLPDDPDYGEDLTALLSKGMTQAEIQRAQAAIEAELRKDDRVDTVAATVTATLSSLEVTAQVTLADAASTEFALIIAVTDGQALLSAIQGFQQ